MPCSPAPINPAEVYDTIVKNGAGSVVLHFAVVKPVAGMDGTTEFINYSACGDVEAELRAIAKAMTSEFNLEDMVLMRRSGRVGLGEVISLVAASALGSEDAFAACRKGLGLLKAMKTIVKDEVFAA